jgi:peptidoglycan/xylan/chitin deacetylase (PgdA/CDA1 family)
MNFPARIPNWIKWFYPSFVWQMPADEKSLFLTFDDGPHPTITPQVLSMLSDYKAKATFFCIGDRVKRYPEIFQRILDEGHAIGNHTQHHIKGWETATADYVAEVNEAEKYICSRLFRPPYGRIKRKQAKLLLNQGFEIIMWTVLSADYDQKLTKEASADRVLRNINNGNIYLFHDSERGEKRMLYALPKLLEAASALGFEFKKIKEVR